MQLLLKDNLLFTTITVAYQGSLLNIQHVLVDIGSATTILSVDILAQIYTTPLPDDILHTIRGVGGSEVVFTRHLDYLQIGECRLFDFEVEIGGMDYGFEINGILGMDFLIRAEGIINLRDMRITFVDEKHRVTD